MVLLSCGCDIDANALTLCGKCYEYLKRTGAVVYNNNIDRVNINTDGGRRTRL